MPPRCSIYLRSISYVIIDHDVVLIYLSAFLLYVTVIFIQELATIESKPVINEIRPQLNISRYQFISNKTHAGTFFIDRQ